MFSDSAKSSSENVTGLIDCLATENKDLNYGKTGGNKTAARKENVRKSLFLTFSLFYKFGN